METAPYYTDITGDHPKADSWWLRCDDGVRIRMALWRTTSDQPKGTVLLFPGRTEYIEKYADAASHFADAGLNSIAIDWRGQGIADRLLDNPMIGHVGKFSDFQRDVQAVMAAVATLELPKPFYLLGHSMGGCIGLRALYEGLPVEAAVFSGPMWGIEMASSLRPVAWSVTWTSRYIGLSSLLSPQTSPNSYVLEGAFEDNTLTRDRSMWDKMGDQMRAHPELGLGGPSMNWLYEALVEMRALSQMPSPDLPCLTFLGTNERIVSPERIKDRMAAWPGSHLEVIQDGEHELMMEDADTRGTAFAQMVDHYLSSAGANPISATG